MRIVEEGYLKRTVAKLNSYAAERDTYQSLYRSIDSFDYEPLQDLSFKSDLTYFREISVLLSVISSIISHPHISTQHEDVILRTEFVNTVSADTFRDTLRDPTLWRKEELHMVPEYVHYHQNIDDLCIYENVFIVMLIKLLVAELGKYEDFYASLIRTFRGEEQLSMDEHNVSVAIAMLQTLDKKLRFIRNTRFYKEINRRYKTPRTIHPTNILLKDRLYNRCFKFYRTLITYPDKGALMRDFSLHYHMLLMKSLKARGFEVVGESGKLQFDRNGSLLPAPMTLETAQYRLSVEDLTGDRGIILTVENKFVPQEEARRARHLLLFSPNSGFSDLDAAVESGEMPTTVEAVSLWNMADVEEGGALMYRNPLSEGEVMDAWLSAKLSSTRASFALYRSFCPACQSHAVNADERSIRHCSHCGSQFAFFTDEEQRENLWFLKLRRPEHGKK